MVVFDSTGEVLMRTGEVKKVRAGHSPRQNDVNNVHAGTERPGTPGL